MKTQKSNYKVIIIGGGLAGLTSAIHLSMFNIEVLVIEKNSYPKHKVCGEYISNETLPYLNSLGFNPFDFEAKRIDEFELTTRANKSIKAKLSLGGFGISRYELDFQLFKLAKRKGAEIVQAAVIDINFANNLFTVKTKNNQPFQAEIVIGAYGKRANLDINLERSFIKKTSPYLAVKTHVITDVPANKVALHNFKGGYCGVSMVEDNTTNLCYITNYKSFKKFKNITEFQEKVVFQNVALKTIFQNSVSKFDQPLSISQISFKIKNPVENHIIMCGDTAGMIHPLCGNGMAMAIRSAQLASETIIDYLHKKIADRNEM
ncbi:MAG: NAD(P)/FAD-dependent oxidoreductase, partial [Flavobacteriaceae bacterium]|nr:NAD(P)/FAD-dependent oxidoreductase [Flavobacteriaceae bacterium]